MIQAVYIAKTQDPEIIKTYGEADKDPQYPISFDHYMPLSPLFQLSNYCYDEKFETTYLFVEELTIHGNHYEKGDIYTKTQLLNRGWLEEEIGYTIVERRALKDISISTNKFLLSGFDDGGSGLFNDVVVQRNDSSTSSVSYNNKKIIITGYFNNIPQQYIKNLKKEMRDAINRSQHVVVVVDNSPIDYRYMDKTIEPVQSYIVSGQTGQSSSGNTNDKPYGPSLPLYTFGIIDSFSIESGEFTKFTITITTNVPHFMFGISYDEKHHIGGNIISHVMEPLFDWTFDGDPLYKKLYIDVFVYTNFYEFIYDREHGSSTIYYLDDRVNPWIPKNHIDYDPYPWSSNFSTVCPYFCRKHPDDIAPHFYLI